MKKVMIGLGALAMMVGCTPSAEEINKTATAIGYAAGLIANQTDIKDDARNAIVDVLNEVRVCIPLEGQTFAEAWKPVINAKVAEMVKAGKIDSATGDIVKAVAGIAAQGVDYLFDVRYPDAKKYEELVAAGVAGAIDGFLTVFKPVNEDGSRAVVEYDKEAYEWFTKNLRK